MFCQSCGNVIKEDQTFCRMCGEQLSVSVLSLPESSLLRRVSSFSLGVIGALIFLFFYVILRRTFNLGADGLFFVFLLSATIIFSGLIALLLVEMKEIKKTVKKAKDKKRIEIAGVEPKKLEEKSFFPVSWSVTDRTTENLHSTKKIITGDL
ncbi:MAG: zinc ribbon domain-containing protein [Pyrinomonadaceae bacterium]